MAEQEDVVHLPVTRLLLLVLPRLLARVRELQHELQLAPGELHVVRQLTNQVHNVCPGCRVNVLVGEASGPSGSLRHRRRRCALRCIVHVVVLAAHVQELRLPPQQLQLPTGVQRV